MHLYDLFLHLNDSCGAQKFQTNRGWWWLHYPSSNITWKDSLLLSAHLYSIVSFLVIHGHIFAICDIEIYQGERARHRARRSFIKVSTKHTLHPESAITQGHIQVKSRSRDFRILAGQDKSLSQRVPLLQTQRAWLGVSNGCKHWDRVSWPWTNCLKISNEKLFYFKWGNTQNIQKQLPLGHRPTAWSS